MTSSSSWKQVSLYYSVNGKHLYHKLLILPRFLSRFWESGLILQINFHMMSSVGQYDTNCILFFLDLGIYHVLRYKADQMRSYLSWYLKSDDFSAGLIEFSNGVSSTFCLVFIKDQSENYYTLWAPYLLHLLRNLGFAWLAWWLNDYGNSMYSDVWCWLVVICNS